MNEKHLFLRGRTYGWLLAAGVTLLGACTDAIEPESWDPGVSNTTLAAPEITAISNADGTKTILSWPVVFGAGGFQMSLFDITNASEPKAIVTDTIIDGSTCEFPREDDSNYKLVVKTLGNEKYNNKGSEEVEVLFSSLVPKIHEAAIPAGTDLAVWLQENQSVIDGQTEEWAVELTCGETYEMNNSFYVGKLPVTFRSSDKNGVPPTIVMGETAGFITESGVKIKNLNFDCSNMTNKKAAIVACPSSPSIDKTTDYYLIDSNTPFVLQNCKITGLKTNLFYDGGKEWAIHTQMIKDCIIEVDHATMGNNGAEICNLAKGFCFDFKILNSTIYSKETSSKDAALIVYSSKRPNQILGGIYPTNLVQILNSTFVNFQYKKSICNYTKLGGQKMFTINVDKCIFLDCGNDRVARDFCGNGNGNETRQFGQNNYWYDGKKGDTGRAIGENLGVDPQFTQNADGIFMVGNAAIVEAGLGDPRGLQ